MNLWLLDASVLLAAEDSDDANHDAARALLESSDTLATLDLAYYEVTNVAITAWGDSSAARRLRDRIAAIADDGGVVRADPSRVTAAAELALEHSLSAYDASYVVAAGTAGGVPGQLRRT